MTSNVQDIKFIAGKIVEYDAKIFEHLSKNEEADVETVLWLIEERQKLVRYFENQVESMHVRNMLSTEHAIYCSNIINDILERDRRLTTELQAFKQFTQKDIMKLAQGIKALKGYNPSPE